MFQGLMLHKLFAEKENSEENQGFVMKKVKLNKYPSDFMWTEYTTITWSKFAYEKVTHNFG